MHPRVEIFRKCSDHESVDCRFFCLSFYLFQVFYLLFVLGRGDLVVLLGLSWLVGVGLVDYSLATFAP